MDEKKRNVNRTRKKQIVIRLTEEEYEKVKAKVSSSGKTQQQYIIDALTKRKVVNTEGLKSLYPEMKRQGNNLNQIAKRLNERCEMEYQSFQDDIKELNEVWQLLRQYLQRHQ